MKILNTILLAILMLTVLISCSKDGNNEIASIDGVFIGVNNDIRTPAQYDIGDTYRFDLFSNNIYDNNVPIGVKFIMKIWDKNREFIGGIGGINSCEALELNIRVFKNKNDLNGKTQIEIPQNLDFSEMLGKGEITLSLMDIGRQPIIIGQANPGQNFTAEYKNSEYYIEFSNLKFENSDKNASFTVSGRIIVN